MAGLLDGFDPATFDPSQFALPEEERKRLLLANMLIGLGGGLMSARGNNWMGAAGSGAVQGAMLGQQAVAQAMKQRGESISQAMNAYKLKKDMAFTDTMANELNGVPGAPGAPAVAGAFPRGGTVAENIAGNVEQPQPAPAAPVASAQTPYSMPRWATPRFEMAAAAAGRKDVADVAHRQMTPTIGQNGEIMLNGQMIGRTTPYGNLWRTANGWQWEPLPQDALDAKTKQVGAEAGATESAQQAAKLPYARIEGPYGKNGAPMVGYQTALIGAPPGVGSPAAPQSGDPLLSAIPRNEQEAGQLASLIGQRGLVAQYVQGKDGAITLGPQHGTPYPQVSPGQGGGLQGADPLAIDSAKGKIAAQTAQDTKIGEGFANDFVSMVQAEKSAPNNIAKYQQLKNYLGNVDTGKLQPQVNTLKAIAAYVAPDLAKEWTKDVPYAQAASALSREMALSLRNPAGGAGMPGNLSNSDRDYLESMIASGQNDPRAIPAIMDAKIALEQRAADIGKLARQYRQQNGRIDENFNDVVRAYNEQHPLFANVKVGGSSLSAGGATPQELEAEMRRRKLLQ